MRKKTLEKRFVAVISNPSQGERPKSKGLLDKVFETGHPIVEGETFMELSYC